MCSVLRCREGEWHDLGRRSIVQRKQVFVSVSDYTVLFDFAETCQSLSGTLEVTHNVKKNIVHVHDILC